MGIPPQGSLGGMGKFPLPNTEPETHTHTHQTLKWGFSASAPLICWAGEILAAGVRLASWGAVQQQPRPLPTRCQQQPLRSGNPKSLQTMPNTPWGARSPPFGNPLSSTIWRQQPQGTTENREAKPPSQPPWGPAHTAQKRCSRTSSLNRKHLGLKAATLVFPGPHTKLNTTDRLSKSQLFPPANRSWGIQPVTPLNSHHPPGQVLSCSFTDEETEAQKAAGTCLKPPHL